MDSWSGLDENNLESVWQLRRQGYPVDFSSVAQYFASIRGLEEEGSFIPPGPSELQADAPGAWSNEFVGNCLLSLAESWYLQAESASMLALLLGQAPYPVETLQALLVEALGAVGNYADEKQAQLGQHGEPERAHRALAPLLAVTGPGTWAAVHDRLSQRSARAAEIARGMDGSRPGLTQP